MPKTVSVYEISQVIGKDVTRELIDAFGGMSCFFSTDPMALEVPGKAEKHEYIVNLFHSGISPDEIAARTGMDKRSITRIIAEQYQKQYRKEDEPASN
jgi:hypothetical protein